MKYLLWLGLIAVIWWVWSKRQAVARRPGEEQRPAPAVEKMVRCAQCGVYLPESDGVAADGRVYCSEAHRQLGPAADGR